MSRKRPNPDPLPVDAVLPQVTAALEQRGATVLTAPTGAGKTTRVPPAVAAWLEETGAEQRQVVVLEPRRIAARAAARRMAWEGGWELGREVGYQVRFDHRSSERTRILVVTEGILVQRLQSDPFLEGVGAVIFDEFHERSLQADLALAMARRVRRQARPDLALVAMSATLDAEPLAAYLGSGGDDGGGTAGEGKADRPCPTVTSEGFLHPVEVEWLDPTDRRLRTSDIVPGSAKPWHVAALAAHGVRRMLRRVQGDVLCFLPGVGEIRRTAEELEDVERGGAVEIQQLYGDLPPEKQDAVLSPSAARRVVLSTNVAETSVTLEGIEAVVDSGWARSLRFDATTGLDRLELRRISKASAEQRKGRAGRLGPGRCLRLWSEHEHRGLPDRETPEIARVDLAGAALQLLAWGESDLAAFPWYEAPDPAALAAAEELLHRLGAVGAGGVTELGRAMATAATHPRLARLLAEGCRRGHPREAALAAALVAERSPLRRRREDGPPHPARSDLLDAAEAVERFERGGTWAPGLNPGAARFALRARDQLASQARSLGRELPAGEGEGDGPTSAEEAVLRAVFTAFPDRLCRRRTDDDGRPTDRAVMVGGQGVELADTSAVRQAELFVAVEVSGRRAGAEPLVWTASAVERDWLPAETLETAVEVELDPERGRVVAARRTRYEDLVLEEREVPIGRGGDGELATEASRVLAAAAAEELRGDRAERVLPLDDPAVESFLARLRFLAAHRPELELPTFGRDELADLLPALAHGRRSYDELRRAPLLDVLRGLLDHRQLAALEREAPERVRVPSGNRIRLDYGSGHEPGEPPVLAVRIQELFGATDTPRVAGGRVPVLLHLLAPNMRPQQITDDLASFWENTYAEVRKELAGRYPKHPWPEDPLAAEPQRRPGRRR